ncbi:MAG: homocysteine S-methyltransferase family protein, partial [Bryobacterales bacterium]|nr:homocysteine S-methyltransferase family protein [Bryobacterales bacterium]
MKRPRAGVTLLELLIAVTLLSLLVAGVLTAMRAGLTALSRTNARVIANRKAVGAQRILEQQLAGFMPVIAECNAAGGQGPFTRVPFFQGETQTMRFVSTYSLGDASRGVPRILEFQVIPGENEAGVRLAREAAQDRAFVAGAIGPLGLRLEPLGPTSFAEARASFAEQAAFLVQSGVDLLVLETFGDAAELREALF